jgi:hypothetical protein
VIVVFYVLTVVYAKMKCALVNLDSLEDSVKLVSIHSDFKILYLFLLL